MNDVERLAQSVMRLPRLYPASFRAEFAEEMAHVLVASLTAAASHGRTALLAMLAREVLGLLYGAARERRRN